MPSPAPIVGMHFRPPAKLILEYLPSGTPLMLVREPDNPYDENAVKVMLLPEHLPSDADFQESLASFGHDYEVLCSGPPIHLAYIARTRAEEFHEQDDTFLSFDGKGKPQTKDTAD